MRSRMLVALSLGAAIAAVGLGSCSYFEYRSEGGEPFLLYSLVLADAHLKVVHVRGTVFGITADTAPFRAFAGPKGKLLDPIGFRAADRQGRSLAVRAGDGRWLVENGGRDFTIEYDVVLTIEDRYSADVRDMMTCVGDDRSRILGRDVFLVPELNVADGVLVDVAMLPGWSLSASSPHVRNRVIVSDCAELPFTLAVSGEYRSLERTVAGTEISLAIADSWSFTDEEFFDVVCRIVAEEIALFGASPRPRYLFVCDENPVMGGERFDYYGIHYGGSMILLLDRRLDRSELMDTPMAIIAHEFFHNWNGEALGPTGNGVSLVHRRGDELLRVSGAARRAGDHGRTIRASPPGDRRAVSRESLRGAGVDRRCGEQRHARQGYGQSPVRRRVSRRGSARRAPPRRIGREGRAHRRPQIYVRECRRERRRGRILVPSLPRAPSEAAICRPT